MGIDIRKNPHDIILVLPFFAYQYTVRNAVRNDHGIKARIKNGYGHYTARKYLLMPSAILDRYLPTVFFGFKTETPTDNRSALAI